MSHPGTPEFLDSLADRLVDQYGESENVDVVRRLREEAAKSRIFREELAKNIDFYELAKLDGPHMDGTHTYMLHRVEGPGGFGTMLYLLPQQADDLTRQLETGVQVFADFGDVVVDS
jgi:hypothetical protein